MGLDLLITLSKNKIKLLGFDIDNEKIKKIKKNISYINYIKNEQIKILNKYTNIYNTFSKISDCDLIIICLPTPLNKSREPDLSAIKKIIKDINIYLKKGQTIILESTTYPGTTEDIIVKKLNKKFKIGKNFLLVTLLKG